MNLREALRQFLGAHNTNAEQVRQELVNLKIDNLVEQLTRDGYLAADPTTQDLARRFAASDPDGFAALMRTPRPTPAQETTLLTPAAPADPTEAEIARVAAESNVPYHEAAAQVSQGGHLNA